MICGGTLRNVFGLKVGVVGAVRFEARIKELVENLPDLAVLVEPLLVVRRVLREQLDILHRRLLAVVRNHDVCRRLMTVPGVGPVVALTYRATVVFGLICAKYQSGEVDRSGLDHGRSIRSLSLKSAIRSRKLSVSAISSQPLSRRERRTGSIVKS